MEKGILSAAELRAVIQNADSEARCFISRFFDEGSFLESGTYVRSTGSSESFDGVITGCGAVDGRLVFAFVQDMSNGRGAFTSASAKKITSLYKTALKAKAPIVGVYTSAGAKLDQGIDAVSGYGAVIAQMNAAKSTVPQVSVIMGACGGAAAIAAQTADFIIADRENGELYITAENESKGVSADLYAKGTVELADTAKLLINNLPENSESGTVETLAPDDINTVSENVEWAVTSGSDVRALIAELSDGGSFLEVAGEKAKEAVCGFSAVNGRIVAVIANQPTENEGRISACAARKTAKFVKFAGRFNIPLLTLVNTVGFGEGKTCCLTKALAELTEAYTSYDNSKITVVVGKAYGSAFTVFGSKELGADLVFALDTAVISVMPPETAIEFMWEDRIKAADDPKTARASLAEEWIAAEASPLSAARSGDIDDVVDFRELRQRIAAGFEVLA